MNLNELVMKRGRGRGNRNILTEIKPDQNKISESVTKALPKRYPSTPASSNINWGKNHISITNSSMSKKSTGSRKSRSEDSSSRLIVALTEGRGEARCEVGIAVISVSVPFLILCQISDSQNYINTLTKINIFNPSEILVPHTFVENFTGNRMIDKVKERFPNLKYIGVPRSTYNKINGFEMLNSLCIPSLNGILLVLQHRYYALAAASALLSYIQDHVFIYYAPGTIKVDYQESEGYAVIDVSTADHLELVSSTRPAQSNKYSSLFGVLNRCQTKIGSRMLRSIILQPPFNVEYIENRLQCVDELIKNQEMLTCIQVLLAKMSNVDSLLSIGTMISNDPMKNSVSQLNYILRLNSILDLIIPLKENLEGFTHPFFIRITKTLGHEGFAEIKKILSTKIQDNAQPARGNAAMLQRCFIIKPGVNGLLDLVRKTYTERMNDMREYVKSLAEKYDLALTVGNNETKGYHIILTLSSAQKKSFKKSDLPAEFIEVHCSTNSRTMKTPELVNLSTRLDDIMNNILKISNMMVHAIIVDIKKHIYLFYILCEEIAQLDVIQSLASTSLINNYVRPNFSEYTEITSARHPLLDILLHTNPVPNDINCSDDFNVNIVTGPNGSGKSIFIRQVILLQVMAQVGCYVPAKYATFKPMDRMFARIYLEDNMEFGASSFILEMKEMKYIMTSLTDNSLVIIDELGRSTALEEGTALAIAILEKLAISSAHIYITTHFTSLTRLFDMYPYVKVWQLETIPKERNTKACQLDYKYNILPGVTSVKHYGVTLVRDLWPNDILKYVDGLLDELSKRHGRIVVVMDEKSRLKYSVESMLRKLKLQHELTIFKINEILDRYQADLKKLGYIIDLGSLESYPQENACMVDDNLVTNVVNGEPSLALNRFLDDSNDFCHDHNNSYHNDENESQSYFNLEVFKKPTQPKNRIKLAQQTTSVALSNDVDDNLSSSLCNEASITSSPVNFLDNICQYSSSSNDEDFVDIHTGTKQFSEISQAGHYSENVSNSYLFGTGVQSGERKISGDNQIHRDQYRASVSPTELSFNSRNVDNDFEDFQAHSKQERELSDIDFRPGNLSEYGILHEEKEVTSDGYIHRNQYENYVSPIVKIIEGLNNKSISWEDQSGNEFSDPVGQSKINIISDIKILSGLKSIGPEETQNNYCSNEPNIIHSKNRKLVTEFNKSFLTTKKIDSTFNHSSSCSVVTNDAEDLNVSLKNNFQTSSQNILQPPVQKIFSQQCDVTRNKNNTEEYPGKSSILLVQSNEDDNDSSRDMNQEILKVKDESDIELFPGNVNTDSSLNISNASTWKLHAAPTNNSVMSTITNYSKRTTQEHDPLNESNRFVDGTNDPMMGYSRSLSQTDRHHNVQNSVYEDDVVQRNISKTITNSPTPKLRSLGIKKYDADRAYTFKKNKYHKHVEKSGGLSCSYIQRSSQSEPDIKNRSLNEGPLNEDSRQNISRALTNLITLDENIDNPSTEEINRNITNSSILNDDHCHPSPHKTEPNEVDFRNDDKTTSISFASKMRKLDEDVTYSSASLDKSCYPYDENIQIDKASRDKTSVSYASALRNLDGDNTDLSASEDQTTRKHSLSLTSISSASRRRNLEDVSSSSIIKTTPKTENITVSTSVEDKSEVNRDHREQGMKRRHKVYRKKFIPPRTLSTREIERELEEQDRRILEISQNSSDMTKYWEHIVNRPTVKQIKNSTHLALVRKTNEGVQVFPAEPKKTKSKRSFSIKRQFSNENFDMSIFSDKNAKTFEKYLNSGERDYNTFRSKVDHSAEEVTSSNLFPFGYSTNLVRNTNENNFVVSATDTMFQENDIRHRTFNSSQASIGLLSTHNANNIRHPSLNSSQASINPLSTQKKYPEQNSGFNMATFNATLQNHTVPPVTEQSNFSSLTPNGFYKQNKEHINAIMSKYLRNTSISSSCGKNNPKEKINIFENSILSFDDMSI